MARHFSLKGWDVVGVGRGAWSSTKAAQWGVNCWVEGEITPPVLKSVSMVPDVVMHCAGGASVAQSLEDPYSDFVNTVQSTVAVLEYVRQYALKARVIYPSSAAVYGNTSARHILEEAPYKPVSPYGLHKELCEKLCLDYASSYGIQASIIRFFSLYGPELPKQLIHDACRKAQEQEFTFFGTGDEERDFLHVRDAAQLMWLASEHATTNCPVVNGGTGDGVTVKHITSLVGRQWAGCPVPQFNGRVRQGDPNRLVAHMGKAESWGFAPSMDMEKGISEYVDWFKGKQP